MINAVNQVSQVDSPPVVTQPASNVPAHPGNTENVGSVEKPSTLQTGVTQRLPPGNAKVRIME